MKVSNAVKELIGDKKSREAKDFRLNLSIALHFTEYWTGKVIEANKDNGPLTTEKALQMIEQFTGFSRSEILVELQETEKVA